MAFDISKFAATLSPDVSDSDTMLREIPIDQLHPNARNFYPSLLPAEIDALTESIEANGLLEPLTVVPGDEPNDYRLISGHNRYRALTSLHERSPEETKWQTIPCIVLPTLTREQELSAIIEANRQRKKNGALLAEEAEKLTESYVARQKAGEKLPGRIRERVAEALRVSQTKLATIQAIKKNLKVPDFREAWETETLPESVAYEISKLEPEAQYRLLDLHVDQGEALTIRTVQQFGKAWLSCCHACTHTGHFCENAMTMVRNLLKSDGWHCAGCCDACLSKASCPYVCRYTKTVALTAEPQSSAEDQEVWRPLDAEHWPNQGELVLLSGGTPLDGRCYLAARCVGSAYDAFPFEDAHDGLSVDDMDDFSEWFSLRKEDVRES